VEARLQSRGKQGVMMGDSAKWIWNLADQYFPGATQIVDLYPRANNSVCPGLYAMPMPSWLCATANSIAGLRITGRRGGLD
jgi:hypothetical protein